MKFKDFQALVLFSSTVKALNLGLKNSRTFKDAWKPCVFKSCLTMKLQSDKQCDPQLCIRSCRPECSVYVSSCRRSDDDDGDDDDDENTYIAHLTINCL